MPRCDPAVLVLGDDGDWSAVEVGKELDARGVRWLLLDTVDFPQRLGLNAQLDVTDADWRGVLVTENETLRLAEVSAVYYRKPRDFDLPAELSGPERRFSHAQARVGLGGVLTSLPARWLSHPSALADAEYKPRQFALLRHAGLTTPPTLVTNSPEAVREFAAAYGELVVKPLAEPIVWEGGGESAVYTRRLAAADLDDLSGVEATAHLFQPFQHKRCECRVIAVRDQLFAVAIHAGSEKSYVDFRADYDSLAYEVVEVPEHVRAGIARYLATAGLAFSAFDFVVRPDDGAWLALEANGSGMWGWLAEECGLPIAAAIADELTKE